jgi:hypothetical protein
MRRSSRHPVPREKQAQTLLSGIIWMADRGEGHGRTPATGPPEQLQSEEER